MSKQIKIIEEKVYISLHTKRATVTARVVKGIHGYDVVDITSVGFTITEQQAAAMRKRLRHWYINTHAGQHDFTL